MAIDTPSTRLAALTMEPEVLERVVRCLPMDAAGHAIGDATDVVHTISAICRTLPSDYSHLIHHLGPDNRTFWREMVLRCFDFSIDRTMRFNVEDFSDSVGNYDDYADDYARAAIDAWDDANPGYSPGWMLVESFRYWKHIHAFFRPTQYGFLRKIQYGELSVDAWPDHEDPFTLFCDLAIIKDKFAPFRGLLEADSEGEQVVHPVLLSAYRDRVKRTDFPFLNHCGYTPHFWIVRRRPVSARWKAFDDMDGARLSDAMECDSEDEVDADDAEDEEDEEDDLSDVSKDDKDEVDLEERIYREGPFPIATRGTLNDFQALVRLLMDDFRSVAVNEEYCAGPTFYIGRMKRSGRWIGLCGQRDY
ncbi:hypothetical protein PINS_up018980 [Pythium insidiosum]|nr:hypothetical protein PINS_up018980 [Pythium insidiosum]